MLQRFIGFKKMQKLLPLNYSKPGTELPWETPFFKYLTPDPKAQIPGL
jgi:hypothetical protein